jgi:hypothetical protein
MKVIKNIAISGTHFWNPGDDFIRDGIMNVLKKVFPDDEYHLNFLFYNFGPANKPQARNIKSNLLSAGDLDNMKDFLDMIIIVGLSGGDEISDLYTWIDSNDLMDKVYIIGGGYENNYINYFLNNDKITLEIFKKAKLITGRTSKYPEILNKLNIPYHHIYCPAFISNIKEIKKSNKKNIAFSIQLPPDTEFSIQFTGYDSVKLALDCFGELYNNGNYNIKIICHYKSEYFYFFNMLKDLGINNVPVEFSSFVADTKRSYENIGMVISTRLHSCIFGNSMGANSILINDTPRHIETLKDIEFTKIVNSIKDFKIQFKLLSELDQTEKLTKFKKDLLNKYAEVLKGVL